MNINSFIIIFLANLIFSTQFRCGKNDLKIKPKLLKPKIEIDKTDPSYKRRMDDIDEDGFKKFNIYVDKINIQNELEENSMGEYTEIILNSIDKAACTLQKLLKVKPLDYGYQFADENLTEFEIYHWDKEKFGSGALSRGIGMNNLGIDLILFSKIEYMGEGIIAAATSIYNQESNMQPILGIIYINNITNFSQVNVDSYLETTLIHEITHVLGFAIEFFDFLNILQIKEDKYGNLRTYINSKKVIEVARNYYDCHEIDGIELEEYGDEGTAGSHWEARLLLGDYMIGVIYSEEVISDITLALLEDLGYYKPYYYTGGLMRYGKNKGCEFVFDKCVNQKTYQINPKFENEFFYHIYSDVGLDPSCSSGRLSRTYNSWSEYEEEIPEEYQYFEGSNTTTGYYFTDGCPVPLSDYYEENDVYFSGSCSRKEGGAYGSNIWYMDSEGNPNFYLSKDIAELTGEEMSEHSFCFLSSLYKNNIDNVEYYTQNTRAICYKLFCSEKSLTVKIHDDYIVCPRAGGKIKVDGYEGYFLCPDYNLMCTGTVMCNDLFDCVDKKSETKEESFIYDYEIKTSQNLFRAELSGIDTDNYELTDDGVCPKYCIRCKENKKCLKCKDGFNLLGNSENSEVICESNDDNKFETGYYHNENNVYYKCIFNCDVCSDSNSCNTCKEGIEYNYNQCININIPNCAQSDAQGICEKCNDNFAFNDTDKSFCINKEEFINNYYTKDNGISYTICTKDISNCAQCEYDDDSNNNPKCTLCEDDYALSVDENKCILKEEIDANKEYYYIDELNSKCKKCSNAINNCLQCTNGTVCDKCMIKYYLKNYNSSSCLRMSEIGNIKEYFLDEDKTNYLSCELYNINNNCKECSNKNICKKCDDGYYVSDGTCKKSSNDCYYLKICNLYLLYLTMFIFILF